MKKTRKLQLAALLVGLSATVAGLAVANDSVTAQATETPVFAMEEGAAVRTKPNDSGIRWITNVDQAWYTANLPDGAMDVSFGTFVTSASNVSSIDELDENFATEKRDLPCTAPLTFTDGTFTYYSAITFGEVAEANQNKAYAAELVARSYMKYTLEGETKYVYADSNDNQRCIRAVALEAIEDTEEFAKLPTDDDRDAVKAYVGTAESQVTMDGGDGVCETTAEPISGDYAVAYQGAKKVGTFTEGTLTLNADFGYNENAVLTLFDADGNYAKTAECKYITQYIGNATEFTTVFHVQDSMTMTGYYQLTDDIVLEVESWKSNITLSGTFDGQGHKIEGLKLYKSNSDGYGGLFRSLIDATVKNVAIIDAELTGVSSGVLANRGSGITIENVYVSVAHTTMFSEYYETTPATGVLYDQNRKGGLFYWLGEGASVKVKDTVIYMPEFLANAHGFITSWGSPKLTLENCTFIGGNGKVVGERAGSKTAPTYVNGENNGYKVIDAVQAYKDIYGTAICTDGKITQAPADMAFVNATNANGWSEMQFNAYTANHPLKVMGAADLTQENFTALLSEIVVLTENATLNTYLGASSKFYGVLDGQGHTIDGITTTGTGNVGGLFATLYGSVKNLALIGADESDNKSLIADQVAKGTYLENVYAETSVPAKAGGLARWFVGNQTISMKNVVINVKAFANTTTPGALAYMMAAKTLANGPIGLYMDNCYFVAPTNSPIGSRGSSDKNYIQQGAGNVGLLFWDIDADHTEDDGMTYYATAAELKAGATNLSTFVSDIVNGLA